MDNIIMDPWRVSYHSLGENVVSKKFLKFMFGLKNNRSHLKILIIITKHNC